MYAPSHACTNTYSHSGTIAFRRTCTVSNCVKNCYFGLLDLVGRQLPVRLEVSNRIIFFGCIDGFFVRFYLSLRLRVPPSCALVNCQYTNTHTQSHIDSHSHTQRSHVVDVAHRICVTCVWFARKWLFSYNRTIVHKTDSGHPVEFQPFVCNSHTLYLAVVRSTTIFEGI